MSTTYFTPPACAFKVSDLFPLDPPRGPRPSPTPPAMPVPALFINVFSDGHEVARCAAQVLTPDLQYPGSLREDEITIAFDSAQDQQIPVFGHAHVTRQNGVRPIDIPFELLLVSVVRKPAGQCEPGEPRPYLATYYVI